MSLLTNIPREQYQLYILHRMLSSNQIIGLAEYCRCSIHEAWRMYMDGIRLTQ